MQIILILLIVSCCIMNCFSNTDLQSSMPCQFDKIHDINTSTSFKNININDVNKYDQNARSENEDEDNKILQFLKLNQKRNCKRLLQQIYQIQQQTNDHVYQKQASNNIFTIQILIYIVMAAVFLSAIFYYQKQAKKYREQIIQTTNNYNIKLKESQQKIKQLSRYQTMFEVYWDKIVYKRQQQICYAHTVYQGRFLNQQVYVYAVQSKCAQLKILLQKLDILLTCSHKRLNKLYYYTRSQKYLLIFTQKIQSLSSLNIKEHLDKNIALSSKKTAIIQILQALGYLQQKIKIKLLPLESIQLNISKNKQEINQYNFKINTIPCLFRKMKHYCQKEDNDTCSQDGPICFVRKNIAELFYLILMDGTVFQQKQYERILLRYEDHHQQYIDFLQFILEQAKAIGHTHQFLFLEILDHPFLWDSKRKLLFISDFSNYIETHLDDMKISRLQYHSRNNNVIKPNWVNQFHSTFISQIKNYRKYNFESIKDLFRLIRNKINHFHQIPKELRQNIGKTPEGFIEYSLSMFPKLLNFAYIYCRKKKWKLHMN